MPGRGFAPRDMAMPLRMLAAIGTLRADRRQVGPRRHLVVLSLPGASRLAKGTLRRGGGVLLWHGAPPWDVIEGFRPYVTTL